MIDVALKPAKATARQPNREDKTSQARVNLNQTYRYKANDSFVKYVASCIKKNPTNPAVIDEDETWPPIIMDRPAIAPTNSYILQYVYFVLAILFGLMWDTKDTSNQLMMWRTFKYFFAFCAKCS
jgi:hypothetical protein